MGTLMKLRPRHTFRLGDGNYRQNHEKDYRLFFELCHKVAMLYNNLHESAQVARVGGEHRQGKGNTGESGETSDS